MFVYLSFKEPKKYLNLFRRDFFSLRLILLIYLICGFAFVAFLMLFYSECWQKYLHNKNSDLITVFDKGQNKRGFELN